MGKKSTKQKRATARRKEAQRARAREEDARRALVRKGRSPTAVAKMSSEALSRELAYRPRAVPAYVQSIRDESIPSLHGALSMVLGVGAILLEEAYSSRKVDRFLEPPTLDLRANED